MSLRREVQADRDRSLQRDHWAVTDPDCVAFSRAWNKVTVMAEREMRRQNPDLTAKEWRDLFKQAFEDVWDVGFRSGISAGSCELRRQDELEETVSSAPPEYHRRLKAYLDERRQGASEQQA